MAEATQACGIRIDRGARVASQQSPILRVNGVEFYPTVTDCQGQVVHNENCGLARRCRRASRAASSLRSRVA